METTAELFRTLEDSFVCHPEENTVFLNLFGVTLNEDADVRWFVKGFKPWVDKKGKINMVANYDGFDLFKGLELLYGEVRRSKQCN
jgi:hypothetical protein